MKDEKEENFHRIERRYGSFVRSFALPATIETDSAQASYENGVLSIALHKKEAAKPKQLKIEIGSGSNSKATPNRWKHPTQPELVAQYTETNIQPCAGRVRSWERDLLCGGTEKKQYRRMEKRGSVPGCS